MINDGRFSAVVQSHDQDVDLLLFDLQHVGQLIEQTHGCRVQPQRLQERKRCQGHHRSIGDSHFHRSTNGTNAASNRKAPSSVTTGVCWVGHGRRLRMGAISITHV